jgi:hypothetical protein
MKYFYTACIWLLLLLGGSISTRAQVTATNEQVKEIQGKLDKIKELKKNGKGDDDADIIKLAKEAIELADKYYKIPADNMDGEPAYDPNYNGDGKCSRSGKKVKVKVGTAGLASPGWLASTKYHEIVAHGGQAATDRWYTDAKGDNINEVEAYDAELRDTAKNGLSREEIDDLKKRREEYYNNLDAANKAKIDKEKTDELPYQLALLPADGGSRMAFSGKSTLFVAGAVLADERMRVSFRGTKTIEGQVVSAELNGQKTEARTDANGNAVLDFAAIATGLTGTATAIIKALDATGTEVAATTANVMQGSPQIFNRPVLEALPGNLPNQEAITIQGQNLGADAQLVCGTQIQETLAASDREMTVFTQCPTGTQPVFVVTANGVSHSQMVNIYSLQFALPKNSISPGEQVQARVHYESIPVGTKLVFTNNSPAAIKIATPQGTTSGNTCTITVTEKNGSIPVNITGISRGGFKIALDTQFAQ